MYVSTANEICDGFVAGNCQKVVSFTSVDCSKRLVSGWTNKKKTRLRDAHWVVWRYSGEPLRERSVVDGWSGKVVLGYRTISSSIIFALCGILRTLITCMNASRVCLLCPLSLLGVTNWPRSCAKKSYSRVCWEFLPRKPAFREDFCFRIRYSLLNTQLPTFGNSLLLDSIC